MAKAEAEREFENELADKLFKQPCHREEKQNVQNTADRVGDRDADHADRGLEEAIGQEE